MNISKLLLVTLLSTGTLGLNAMQADLKQHDSKQHDAKEAAHAKAVTWQCIKTMQMPEGPLFLVSYLAAVSKNIYRDTLVSGDSDGTITFWNSETFLPLTTWPSFEKPIVAFAATDDTRNDYIAFALQDGECINVIKIDKKNNSSMESIHIGEEITGLSFIEDDTLENNNLKIHCTLKSRARSHSVIIKWHGTRCYIQSKISSPDNGELYSCRDCNVNYFVKSPKNHIIIAQGINHSKKINTHRSTSASAITCINCGIIKDDDDTTAVDAFDFISGSADGTIQLWDSNKGCIHTLKGHIGAITSLDILESRIGKKTTCWRIASASDDGTIKIWELREKKPVIERPIKDDKPESYKKCTVCSRQGTNFAPLKLCARCQDSHIKYCSRECQLKHWKEHKQTCTPAKKSDAPKDDPTDSKEEEEESDTIYEEVD